MSKVYRNGGKRILDGLLSLCLLPVLGVSFLLIGILIKKDDGGPVVYRSTRLGRWGRPFVMYKFRTMKVGALDLRNPDRSTYTKEDDPRLTKAGRFLRKTSLDELPQVINVLKGEMSLIGPRPDLVSAETIYTPRERKKLTVRPGISGYTQAYFRNSIPMKEKFRHDVDYVERLSFWLDLDIAWQTIKSVLQRRHVYASSTDESSDERGSS